ncbi:ABC transporter permease [Lysobacter korlensis]|uniref:ABC transporter permease n=1 Tax=Lysobacter korlensis TaxID=553636 RepID=UPI0036D985A6
MDWVLDNLDLLAALTVQHIRLSVPPIVIGLAVALPVGWVAFRFGRIRGAVLSTAGILYAIPSLALFPLLPALFGIGFLSELNVTIALSIYALALLSRSVCDALNAVDRDVRQSATALGYSSWRRFWAVELPLAGPVILAGLRVAAVSTVSLVTVGVLIGVQSLGYLFINGFERRILEEIFTGVLLTMLVALLFDAVLVLLGRALMPWARGSDARRAPQRIEVAP